MEKCRITNEPLKEGQKALLIRSELGSKSIEDVVLFSKIKDWQFINFGDHVIPLKWFSTDIYLSENGLRMLGFSIKEYTKNQIYDILILMQKVLQEDNFKPDIIPDIIEEYDKKSVLLARYKIFEARYLQIQKELYENNAR